MIQYSNLIDFQFMLFVFLAVGYGLRKFSVITAIGRGELVNLTINVILPCNIIYSFLIDMDMDIIRACGVIFLVSVGIQVFYELFSAVAYRGVDHDRRMVLKYATLCPNSGFLGNPLIEGLYGAQGLLYASIYLIPQRIVIWSSGVACFTAKKERRLAVMKKVLTHPCVIAAGVGIIIMLFQIQLPGAVVKTLKAASSCTTALIMIIVGGILAEIDFRTVFSKLVFFYCGMRLLGIPAVVLTACWLLRIDPLVSAVSVVLAGMPAGTTTAILAEKYGGDAQFGVKCVFLSTVCSLLTIPVLCIVIEHVFV